LRGNARRSVRLPRKGGGEKKTRSHAHRAWTKGGTKIKGPKKRSDGPHVKRDYDSKPGARKKKGKISAKRGG